MLSLRPAVTALVLLALTSCSATRLYDGPARLEHEVVRIKGMSNADPLSGFTGTSVCAIDGRELEGCPRHVEFLPGTHELRLERRRYGLNAAQATVVQDFAPGERHVIGISYSANDGMKPALIITDIVTADG